MPPELLEQLQLLLGPETSQANAAAEKLGQIFRQKLSSRHLQIFLDACQGPSGPSGPSGPASKRRREGGNGEAPANGAGPTATSAAERNRSLQQLSELFPHCVDPGALEALVPHLHLTPQEWSQVWPAFQLRGAAEATALGVLFSLASKHQGMVDIVVHLVGTRRVKLESFREAVAQAVPQDLGSGGQWIDEELPPRSRSMRDTLCQTFVQLFPLCQDADQGPRHTWNFDTWWTELTTSLQGAAPGAALALVAGTLLQLQQKGPLTLELVLRPKRRRRVWTWLTQQVEMLPEAQSVASFMARLGRHSMQAGAGPRPSSVVTSAVEAVEVEDVEDVAPEVKVVEVAELADDLREAAWYQTAT